MTDVGHGLRESFFMLWDTWWALVLGFGISGAVQAFASRAAIRSRLGDHRPLAVARATVYGTVSSSCSYAASAMARSLFAKGADLVACLVFMVASTNLVVELGIVLVVLLGWAFLGAEVVGGLIMIGLLATLGGLWLRGRTLVEARAAVGEDRSGEEAADRAPWRRRIRTAGGWADAAGYTMSDLGMVRRELAIGFVAAGFASVLLPGRVWADVLLHGHGFWTTLENVVVGPLVALLSCVCSVGNVPLAAALWHGGATFGGVISFIFADLIALPLVLIYRRQYGRRVAVRLLALLWVTMSAAGLVTEELFRALGAIPGTRPRVVAGEHIGLDATLVLNVVACVALAGLWWLHRNRDRFGGGTGYANDPICGMQVETALAPAARTHRGQRFWFCCEGCAEHFDADPDRHLSATGPGGARPPVTAGTGPATEVSGDPSTVADAGEE